jgi:hypothetical protein
VQLPKLADNQITNFNPCLVGSVVAETSTKNQTPILPGGAFVFKALNFARDLIAKEKI